MVRLLLELFVVKILTDWNSWRSLAFRPAYAALPLRAVSCLTVPLTGSLLFPLPLAGLLRLFLHSLFVHTLLTLLSEATIRASWCPSACSGSS